MYLPAPVLNLFNNWINISQSKRMIHLNGVFLQGMSSAYNGYYYDTLYDVSLDAQLTLIIPALIRNELQLNKILFIFPGRSLPDQRVVNNNVHRAANQIEVG